MASIFKMRNVGLPMKVQSGSRGKDLPIFF